MTFLYKDYRDSARKKPIKLTGTEFLRRFCFHILSYRFVRIRYFGIYSSKFKAKVNSENKKIVIKIKETTQDRLFRLTEIDVYKCPFCKKGRMIVVEIFPRIRTPVNPLYRFPKTLTF